MKKYLLFLPFLFCSCFLFGPKFKQSIFSYTENNQQHSLPIIVLPGYTSQKTTTDSVGNTDVIYNYGKAILYVTYVQDTLQDSQPIDTSINVPRIHPHGGLIYKGMNDNEHFWREIHRGHLRFGYRDVPRSLEIKFDSATNYASGLPPLK